jgi:hypothetical protein
MIRETLYPKLKRIGALRALNARVKAAQLRRGLRRLRDHYEKVARDRGLVYSEGAALALMRRRLATRGASPSPVPRGRLRVLWVGAHWAQDSSGFLAGLGKLADVVYFHNEEGGYGLRTRWDGRDLESNARALRKQLAAMRESGPVHLVLGQMWAQIIGPDALREAQSELTLTANISMDDRLPEHWASVDSVRGGSVGLGPGLDMVLTSSPETPEWFLAEDIPALYVPMASDPERFRPFEEDQKRYDVSFIGSKYGLRERIVTAVMAAGINVDAFGPGWPKGPVNADQNAEIFGRSRIVLGMGTVGHNDDLFTIKLRDFDAPMSGALYVTHRNPDLLQLYREHEEIACYLSIEECVRKLRYYLAHPDDRRRVAAAGMARARREHSWEGRLARALSMMGLLEAPSP